MAAFDKLDNLCAIVDVNGLGQSRPEPVHDTEAAASPHAGSAFGWHTIVIDGHDMKQILDALAEASATKGKPTMILAKTFKGKGVSFRRRQRSWHGKALKKGEEFEKALKELEAQLVAEPDGPRSAIRRTGRHTVD